MAVQSSGSMLSSGFITIYGGVSTITFTTTVTASDLIPSAIFALSWPTPPTTQLVEYTSLAVPTDPASKYFPDPLPIFVATEVVGILVNTAGQPITTIIEVQAQPAYVYGALAAGGVGAACIGNYYICWSAGKKAGIILATILGGLLFLVFIIWVCCFMRIPRPRKSDEEESTGMRARDREQGLDEGGGRRRKRVRNPDPDSTGRQGTKRIKRRHSSLSSGSFTEPPKPLPRIVVAEGYREIRRVSSVPRHFLSSETSSGSTGRGAVVGVGLRDPQRNGLLSRPTTAHDSAAAQNTATVRNIATIRNAAAAFPVATVPNAAPLARSDLDTAQREIRSDSSDQVNVNQQGRGRSPRRQRSSRNRSPKTRSHSPRYQSKSPRTNNRSSFAPYIPLAVAALEHLWERLEDSSYQNDPGRSRTRSSQPEAHSHQRSLREERRTSRQHRDSSQCEQPSRSRSVQQEVTMSGGRQESPAGPPPPIPQKSSRRRLSNYI